ncbi:NifU family protein [Edaphobacter aggregans]|uniref:NifU family protein n=1 Tax=Edaphobacter aggregans TaxID=570835 RepID=UPI000550B417|nr:NifU family protein [Edaphobacter aggregans]
MAGEREFQEKVRQLGALVGELDPMQESGSRVSARKLVQLLMEVHGTGLERMMEIVFDSGAEGEAMIAKLGRDPIVRSLLLLYSLHPEDIETRVLRALETVGSRLRKFDSRVELVSVRDGAVQLQLQTSGHVHGSAAKNLRAIVEEAIYEQAPDVTSLMILGLEDEDVSGFVPLERLLKQPAEAPVLVAADLEEDGAR